MGSIQPTTAVEEFEYAGKNSKTILKFIDTGVGLYNRRKMFKPLVESCKTIIFMFSIGDFFKVDSYCNLQFNKALNLFKKMIVETECSKIYLVVNKCDLLNSKLKGKNGSVDENSVDLKAHFNNLEEISKFEGRPDSKRDVKEFIIKCFNEKAIGKHRSADIDDLDEEDEQEESDEVLLHDL